MASKPIQLSTHVLDVAQGRPASGVRLGLWFWRADQWILLVETVTNPDGRTDAPLLDQDRMVPGIYELRYQAGAYYQSQGTTTGAVPFLDEIPIRFGISGGSEALHIPLLMTPWSYSTYRGS